MHNFFSSILILRPLNLLLSLISVIIAAYLTNNLHNFTIIYIIIIVISFNGAANIINDIYDIDIDKINQPNRILPSAAISIKTALIIAIILFSIGVICSFNIKILGQSIVIFFALPLIVLYTPYIKPLPLIGNLIISILIGLVFIITESGLSGYVNKMWIPFILATILSLIREIIKDCADLIGDRICGLNTFPIKYGFVKSLYLVRLLSILLLIISSIPVLYYSWKYTISLYILVLLPLIYLVFLKLNKKSKENDYENAASTCKFIIIGGMFVILLLK